MRDVDVSLFNAHVTADKNNFADWVQEVFGWEKLADMMRRTHSPQEMIHAIDDFVNHYKK